MFNEKRRPVVTGGAGLEASRRSSLTYYLNEDGGAILPLSILLADELDRRWQTVARAARAVTNG